MEGRRGDQLGEQTGVSREKRSRRRTREGEAVLLPVCCLINPLSDDSLDESLQRRATVGCERSVRLVFSGKDESAAREGATAKGGVTDLGVDTVDVRVALLGCVGSHPCAVTGLALGG